MTSMLKQSKEIHTSSGIREDISKQTDVSNTGCEGSLFLCKERFQAQGHSYATVQGATSCVQLPFPAVRNMSGGQNGEEMLGKRNSICKEEKLNGRACLFGCVCMVLFVYFPHIKCTVVLKIIRKYSG